MKEYRLKRWWTDQRAILRPKINLSTKKGMEIFENRQNDCVALKTMLMNTVFQKYVNLLIILQTF